MATLTVVVCLVAFAPYDSSLQTHADRTLYIRGMVWYDITFGVLWTLLTIWSVIAICKLTASHFQVLPRLFFCLAPPIPLCLALRSALFFYSWLTVGKVVDNEPLDAVLFEFVDECVGEIIPLLCVAVTILTGKVPAIAQTLEGLSAI